MAAKGLKKVLLMGKSGSGKTSMRSIIFANFLAKPTMRLGPTLHVDHDNVKFLGNLVLNLWDCGGQDAFMEAFFNSERAQTFSGVHVLIYVFDVDSHEHKKDIDQFVSCLQSIDDLSPDARVFCLIHKMDLIKNEDDRTKLLEERREELSKIAAPRKLTVFRTSIWDETLYKAWSEIVYQLVPNVSLLKEKLTKLCNLCGADEVVLFEKATFLVISHAISREHKDVHRFEKISNIIKHYKLTCGKTQARFKSMEVKNSTFTALVDVFTTNTYIMVIMSNPRIQCAAVQQNVQFARSYFEQIIKSKRR
mmetsp:Transcript_27937/g.67911  ORF Transcript_27937/g.67911 Transcript_27937/m.67911 type:complete len:307 (+) Transcript_27937:92-1012(+)|eukprot:CAMPEP_0114508150 /NCGR_PEP_ID=MMETSP0109-20121206/12427_1 /TAXON_ID=29199 /ORGANISM="Chlorarachnion reptans, Strain CCCM449" /LENGTH=306 /DNA_ID=CAMNT_0001687025 /DNA_START=27 /DNA_END=947 /DNA_ORIENTATION=-